MDPFPVVNVAGGMAVRQFEAGGQHKVVIGLVHLVALPGGPFHDHGSLTRTLDAAKRSAIALEAGGADGCLLQTVERVYTTADHADPATVAAATLALQAVRDVTSAGFGVGVQIMRNALRPSLAVASVGQASFVRVAGIVGRTLTAYGLVEPDAHALMEYRAKLRAWDIAVVADVDSDAFSWHGDSRPAGAVARAAKAVGADAVAVGAADDASCLAKVASVREHASDVPVVLAGHTHHGNAARLLRDADGAFVGTCLQPEGWGGSIDEERVLRYVDIVRGAAT